MKLLLDTHTLLWWSANDQRLSATARDAILLNSNEDLVSAAYLLIVAALVRACPPD